MINRIIFIILIFLFNKNIIHAQEIYTFETKSIEITENGEFIEAKKGKAISTNKDVEIKADIFQYSKISKKLKIKGNAEIFINSNNLKIEFDEGVIDQNNFIFESENKVIFKDLNNKIKVSSKKLNYDKKKNIINSPYKSNISDAFGNRSIVDNFKFEINKKLLKVKNLDFYDVGNNNLKLSIAYMNIETNNLYGKDVVINLNDKDLKIDKENQPRLSGNSILNNDSISEIKKGVFTLCKKTDTCPPWEISAKTIIHDKEKKIIKYENALLKFYDKPIVYFPTFRHPDPTVERQSGFLTPSLKSSSNKKNFLNLPYFFVISDNKDATLSTRLYDGEQILFQTEYRQANYNSNHISDFSFKIDDNKKLKNHFFYRYNKKINLDNFDDNDFSLKIQTTSKDTYLKKNKIKSKLIDNENILENSAKLVFNKNNNSTTIQTFMYEDLNKNESDRYEYIIPKIDFRKRINKIDEFNGNLLFESQIMGNHYNTNILEKININNLLFESLPKISKKGLYNNYKLLIKNSNTDAKNSNLYKNKENYYLSGLMQFNSSLPLKKDSKDYERLLNPKISLRLAPSHTKDHRSEYTKLDINNLYSIDRIQKKESVEGGASLTYGNEFSINNKRNNLKIFDFKIANNLRLSENKDVTAGGQLGKKVSSILSEISVKPNNFISIDYNSSVKNNLDDINYENLITEFNLNNILKINFDYLNHNETLGDVGSYLSHKTSLFIDDKNQLSFSTRRNKNINLTEYYNLAYQYENDCFSASIEYNKEFYQDRDLKPNNSLFLKFSIIPTKSKNRYSELFN